METYEYRVMHKGLDGADYQYSITQSLGAAVKHVVNLEQVATVAGIRPIWIERRVVGAWDPLDMENL